MTEQEKQSTLAETLLKEQLQKLDKKLLELEVKIDGIETGCHLIWQTLEAHGFVKNGEIVKKEPPWNPHKIEWQQVQGTKGLYERYPLQNEKAEATLDFKNLLADLKQHNGKLTRNGVFYWLFTDQATIGRKRRK